MDIRSAPDSLEAQDRLVEQVELSGWGLMIGDAFVRGMRDIGYKSTAFAVAELVDNSIQAGASNIDIVFGFDSGAKPTKMAIVDDGHGMKPNMVRASLVWGAGTRAMDRGGFGKYGYGLPSASVSQCGRVTVYSKVAGGAWHRAYLDIDEIATGKWSNGSSIEMPKQVAEEPPAFVLEALKKDKRWGLLDHGTVVLWERLDPNRIDYKRREELRNALVTDLGVIFRKYLVDTPMKVDGIDVEPCDPLFLTEGFRYYDLDEDRAIELPPATVEVKDKQTGEVVGKMRVRFARFPVTFFRKPEMKRTNRPGKSGTNDRLEIADHNNGIIFCRNGRQIDVLRPPRKYRSINATTDRFWAVEVDFDATLDDMFAITTSKQQVTPDARVWDILDAKANMFTAIGEMHSTYRKEAKQLATEVEQAKERDRQRASVEAIESAAKFRTTAKPKDTPRRQAEAAENLEQEAKQRANRAGVRPEAIKQELEAEREGITHTVDTEDMPGAPFFRCVQEGGTRVLYLNVAHPFYTELYAGPNATARLRAGLEVLLWALGEAEVDADPESDRRRFYARERASVWTPYLGDSLSVLQTISLVEDDDAADETEAA
jgi:hypothetical protein